MAESADDFATLLDRARRGDADALATLSRQYEPKVRIVARVLLGPALRPYLDSMDLVQSVHRSLLLGLRQQRYDFDGPDKLVALALMLLRRKVARKWRHMQRQRRLEGGTADTGDLPTVLASLTCPQDDPAAAAQLNDQVRHVCAALDTNERRMLELRLQGHELAEIAAELGLSPVALRVRLTRLRQRLRAGGVLDDWL